MICLMSMTDRELDEYEIGLSLAIDAGENVHEEYERVLRERERRHEDQGEAGHAVRALSSLAYSQEE